MARRTKRLTAKLAERSNKPGRFNDGNGLYLQIINAQNKSWLLRYERGGRERWMGLGPLHTYTLAEARERARQARQLLHDGMDPITARETERAAKAAAQRRALTFEQATREFFKEHEDGWRNGKHRSQVWNTLERYAFPHIGKMPVAEIATPDVLAALRPIWRTKTETASRVRGRIERVLAWATVNGYRTGDNPARWQAHLQLALPARSKVAAVEHHPALPYAEVPEFMAKLANREGTAARALAFTILTAARTGEVTGARWGEIDQDGKVWTVPKGRMKGNREHRVPLSDRAVAILRELPTEQSNPFVFVGPREGSGLSNMAMTAVMKRMGHDKITVHGFRSSFRDWSSERTDFQNHVVEMALAHAVGDKVEKAYRRGELFEKRRKLMDVWAAYCARPAATGAAVVPLRHARS
jgi:integrase